MPPALASLTGPGRGHPVTAVLFRPHPHTGVLSPLGHGGAAASVLVDAALAPHANSAQDEPLMCHPPNNNNDNNNGTPGNDLTRVTFEQLLGLPHASAHDIAAAALPPHLTAAGGGGQGQEQHQGRATDPVGPGGTAHPAAAAQAAEQEDAPASGVEGGHSRATPSFLCDGMLGRLCR